VEQRVGQPLAADRHRLQQLGVVVSLHRAVPPACYS